MTTIITTSCLSLTAEERIKLASVWRAQHALRTLSGADMLLYNILRGKAPRSGFVPITNRRKLANGMHAWCGFQAAVADLDNAYMDGRRLHGRLRTLLCLADVSAERMTELSRAIGEVTTQLRRGV